MKGRKFNRNPTAGENETVMNLRKNSRSNTEVSSKTDLPTPKPLAVIHGKRAGARLDKPVRGKADADAYKHGGGIHIKKKNKGALHRALDVPEGEDIPEAKIKKAEHSKSKKMRARAQFADNAKHFKH